MLGHRIQRASLFLQFFHPVECAAGFEPLDLSFVEAVVELDCVLAAILVRKDTREWLRGQRWGRGGGGERGFEEGERTK